jgi:hypothetical protein
LFAQAAFLEAGAYENRLALARKNEADEALAEAPTNPGEII